MPGARAPGFVAEKPARGELMSLEELRNPNTDSFLCSVTSDRHQVRFPVPVEPGIVGAFHLGSSGLLGLVSPKPLLRQAYLRRDITEGTTSAAQDSVPSTLLVPISLTLVC